LDISDTSPQITDKFLAGRRIHTVIEPPKGWAPLELKEVWKFRELLFFLTWRDIMVSATSRPLWVLSGRFSNLF
jgi:hypothetical protein